MKILCITVSWNEERLVPHFLNHYTEFCDKIIVYDNKSTDKTVELLLMNKKVEVISFDTKGQFNDFKHKDIKETAWLEYKDDYDWVICVDFDEFLYHPDLVNELKTFKKLGITVPSIYGFHMKTNIFPSESYSICEQVRYGKYAKQFSKNVIFDPKKITKMNYTLGCHYCEPIGDVVFSTKPLYLLHMKQLGKEYETYKCELYLKRIYTLNKQKNLYKELKSRIDDKTYTEDYIKKHYKDVFKEIVKLEYNKNPKSAIVTYWENYTEEMVYPFFDSLYHNVLKNRVDVDVFVFIKNIKVKSLQKLEEKYDCRIRFIDVKDKYKHHINTYRHKIYSNFMKRSHNRYQNIFILDIRDIIFQNSHFLDNIKNNKINIYAEDKKINNIEYLNTWEKDCYNLMDIKKSEKDKMLDGEYFCAGTIFGPVPKMIEFLDSIFETCETLAPKSAHIKFALETAAFNYLIKCTDKFEFDIKNNHSDDVFMFSRYKNKEIPFKKDEYGNLLNSEGVPFSILHFNGMPEIPEEYLQQIGLSRNEVYGKTSGISIGNNKFAPKKVGRISALDIALKRSSRENKLVKKPIVPVHNNDNGKRKFVQKEFINGIYRFK